MIIEKETGFRKILLVDDYCLGCGQHHIHYIVELTTFTTYKDRSAQGKYMYYYCEAANLLTEDEDMIRRNQKEYERVLVGE